ncbi:MAG: DUF5915 domain-containing protein, partial [Microcella pacifica]
LELTDRIVVEYEASDALAAAIAANAGFIRSETLAVQLEASATPAGDHRERFSIGEESLGLAISRTAAAGLAGTA